MEKPKSYNLRKAELLRHCRYYKGEQQNPFEGQDSNAGLFWFYEEHWVETLSRSYNNAETYREDYKYLNLGNFYIEVNVPRSLIGLLVNRYLHWSDGYGSEIDKSRAFKNWFLKEYMQQYQQ